VNGWVGRPGAHDGSVQSIDQALLVATRELLWIDGPRGAQEVAIWLVTFLGGRVCSAGDEVDDALHIDLSFGAGTVLLPVAGRTSVERMLLERHLPTFVEDAHRALSLVRHAGQGP
jgi:hypothetical protein